MVMDLARNGAWDVTRRVLIADDHRFVSSGLARTLEALSNCEVVATPDSGLAAIAEIRRLGPDCAVLDYAMPGANGLEVYLEARRWSPGTRFVLLTGTASAGLLRQLVAEGIEGVLLKDGNEGEIIEAIEAVCEGKRYMGQSAARLIDTAPEGPALTPRELEVLQAVARGLSNSEAAEVLGISPKTVNTHRTSLMRKLDVHSTARLVLVAVAAGLIEADAVR